MIKNLNIPIEEGTYGTLIQVKGDLTWKAFLDKIIVDYSREKK